MLFHKNRNMQIQVYTIQQHLELEKLVKLVKHIVSFIGKELVEDRRLVTKSLSRQWRNQIYLYLETGKFVFKRK